MQVGARDGAETPHEVGMAALGWPTACSQASLGGKPVGQLDGDPSGTDQLYSSAAGASTDLPFSDPGVKHVPRAAVWPGARADMSITLSITHGNSLSSRPWFLMLVWFRKQLLSSRVHL